VRIKPQTCCQRSKRQHSCCNSNTRGGPSGGPSAGIGGGSSLGIFFWPISVQWRIIRAAFEFVGIHDVRNASLESLIEIPLLFLGKGTWVCTSKNHGFWVGLFVVNLTFFRTSSR
jgi:hypothetical protein